NNDTIVGGVWDATNQTGTNSVFTITGTNDTLRDIAIINASTKAIRLNGAHGALIDRAIIEGPVAYGVSVESSDASMVAFSTIKNAPTAGIIIDSASANTQLVANAFPGTTTPVSDASTTTTRMDASGLVLGSTNRLYN